MQDPTTSAVTHAHTQLEETTTAKPAGARHPCPSGAVCSAGVKRLKLLGALKRCGVCHKRDPFKRVFKCRGCKLVYHRDCGERTLAAAAAFTVGEDRDVLVDPVNPTATRQEPTTTTVESRPTTTTVDAQQPAVPACVRRTPACMDVYVLACTYIYMGTYVLVAERRRLAANAAERRRRAASGSLANPTAVDPQQPAAPACVWPMAVCSYVHVYVYVYTYMCTYVLAAHAADRRRRAANAADERQRADRLAATGSPANPTARIASVRVEGGRETLAADRRRQRAVVRAAKRRRRAAKAAEKRQSAATTWPRRRNEVPRAETCVNVSTISPFEFFRQLMAERAEDRQTSQTAARRSPPPDRPSKMTRKDYEEMSADWNPAAFDGTSHTVTVYNSYTNHRNAGDV